MIQACPPYCVCEPLHVVFDGHASACYLCQCLVFIMASSSTTLLCAVIWLIVDGWRILLQRKEKVTKCMYYCS